MQAAGTNVKRPTALNAVAAFFIVTGVAGLDNGFSLGSFLYLVAGIGLLKYWRGWRGYALFSTCMTMLFLLPGSVYAMMHPEWIVLKFPSILIDQREHAVIPRPWLALVFISYMGLSVWIMKTLIRRDVRSLFQAVRA